MRIHQRCITRQAYKFMGAYVDTHTGRKIYVWNKRIPGDSRVEQITCDAEWFWSQR
jgi:hypothetical protein